MTGLWARTSALWAKEGVKTVLTDVAIRKAKLADKRYSPYDTGGLFLEVSRPARSSGVCATPRTAHGEN